MTGSKTLPTVVAEKHTDNQLEISLLIEPDLSYFPGHFPTASILPGVVQIQWAEHFASSYFRLGAFSAMEALKFQRVLRPGDNVQLFMEYNGSTQVLNFRYETEQGIHSQGRLKFV